MTDALRKFLRYASKSCSSVRRPARSSASRAAISSASTTTSAITAAAAIRACGDLRRQFAGSATTSASCPFVTGLCIVMYVLTLLLSGANILVGGGLIGLPRAQSAEPVPASARPAPWPVFVMRPLVDGAQRVVAARRPAAHPLQHDVGSAARAGRRLSSTGPGRMVIIYTVAGVVGFALTSMAGAYSRVPAVPAGRAVHGRRVGVDLRPARRARVLRPADRARASSTRRRCTTPSTLFVFGLIMPGVDNYAHAGGFVGGYLAGRLLDPLKPERINHLAIALVLPRAVGSLDHRVGHSRAVGHAVIRMRKPSSSSPVRPEKSATA